eukprot:jgi/Bigna1/80533/fgenesh1_pg.72_\
MKRLACDIFRLISDREFAHLSDAKVRCSDGDIIDVHIDILRMRVERLEHVLALTNSSNNSAKSDLDQGADSDAVAAMQHCEVGGLDDDEEGREDTKQQSLDATTTGNVLDLTAFPPEAVRWVIKFIYGNGLCGGKEGGGGGGVAEEQQGSCSSTNFPFGHLDAVRKLDRLLHVRRLQAYLRKTFGFGMERKDVGMGGRNRKKSADFFDLKRFDGGNVRIVAGNGKERHAFTVAASVLSVRSSFFAALFSQKWMDMRGESEKEGGEKKRRIGLSGDGKKMTAAPLAKIESDYNEDEAGGRKQLIQTFHFADISPQVMHILLHYSLSGKLPSKPLIILDAGEEEILRSKNHSRSGMRKNTVSTPTTTTSPISPVVVAAAQCEGGGGTKRYNNCSSSARTEKKSEMSLPMETCVAVLHAALYFGMEYLASDVEWMIVQALTRENLAKVWSAIPVVPQSGNR